MAYSQTDIDALDKAIASGARRVQIQGRSVEYRSVDEMLKAKAVMVRELSTATRRTRFSPVYDKDVR